MSEDLEALLREHYRRAAEDIRPDAGLVTRLRHGPRPARVRTWPRVLAAAAAVVIVALATWGLFRPARHEAPVAPPPATVGGSPVPRTPTPSSSPRSVRPPVRRPAVRVTPSAAAPSAMPPRVPSPSRSGVPRAPQSSSRFARPTSPQP
jgi:hypothetical protein